MPKYRVVALSCGTEKGRILHSQEVVDGDVFEEGEAERLVQEGFLAVVKSEKTPTAPPQKEVPKAKKKSGLIGALAGTV